MESYQISRCYLENVSELKRISFDTFWDTFSAQNTVENMKAYMDEAYKIETLEKELQTPDSYFYFLKKDNQIVGYLKLNINKAQSEIIQENSLEIERIYIRKEFKRQGFGKQLIKHAENIASEFGKSSIWLGVWEFNPNAIKFYEQMGFKEVGSHSFFMGEDEQTDLILLKTL